MSPTVTPGSSARGSPGSAAAATARRRGGRRGHAARRRSRRRGRRAAAQQQRDRAASGRPGPAARERHPRVERDLAPTPDRARRRPSTWPRPASARSCTCSTVSTHRTRGAPGHAGGSTTGSPATLPSTRPPAACQRPSPASDRPRAGGGSPTTAAERGRRPRSAPARRSAVHRRTRRARADARPTRHGPDSAEAPATGRRRRDPHHDERGEPRRARAGASAHVDASGGGSTRRRRASRGRSHPDQVAQAPEQRGADAGTSSSSSTVANGCSARWSRSAAPAPARFRAARRGPRRRGVEVDHRSGAGTTAGWSAHADAGRSPARGTTSCSPSTRTRARLRPSRSASWSGHRRPRPRRSRVPRPAGAPRPVVHRTDDVDDHLARARPPPAGRGRPALGARRSGATTARARGERTPRGARRPPADQRTTAPAAPPARHDTAQRTRRRGAVPRHGSPCAAV